MSIVEKVESLLQALEPTVLKIADDSHYHAEHAEGKSGAHLRLRIVSEQFNGLLPLARHRLIYQAVGDFSLVGIHALAITALTPSEAA
ncbi:MAG: BolA family transcriptional regulator [Proteobacteria bacterium]|nr:BolA family transcriptional regulator [Pseudomonadota bacterium]